MNKFSPLPPPDLVIVTSTGIKPVSVGYLHLSPNPQVRIKDVKTRRFDLIDRYRGPQCKNCGGYMGVRQESHSPEECNLEHARQVMES